MVNLNYEQIGLKIKRKRKSLSLTQLQLAEKIGLTESSVSRYEAGKISTMPISTLNKICLALNITLVELLGLKQSKPLEYDLKSILVSIEELLVSLDDC